MLLGGVAGGVIVFVLTTTAGVVVRTVHQGRELRGLARVLWPEMKRNWLANGVIVVKSPHSYQSDYSTRAAWIDTRVRLSQLMQARDFEPLARYYDDIESLEAAVARNDPIIQWYAGKAQDHERMAMRVVEGYCAARWRPFGHHPGPPGSYEPSWTQRLLEKDG